MKALFPICSLVVAVLWVLPANAQVNVAQFHNHASRDGLYIDSAFTLSAAAKLTREGTTVRFEFAIHVPEDETSFYVFHAPSAHHSALAAQDAGLVAIRVVEALMSKGTEQ